MNRKVTMKDIAERLNVSINAVSLVLNNKAGIGDETRTLVLKAADEMGYFDNKPKYLNSYASKNICLVLERRFFNDPYFYSKVIMGIEQEARKNSYDLIMSFIDDEENYKVPNCLENRKASGIIALGPLRDDYLITLSKFGLPMVLVDNSSFLEPIDSILTDNKLGAYKATRYLLNKGFKKLGFFGDLAYSLSIKERYFGFSEAMRNSLLYEDHEEYIKKYSITSNLEELIIKHDTEAIVEKIRKLGELPEAFICSNDSAAIQLNNALTVLGYKVPEDISLIGFDDIALCNMMMPKLTTVRVNKELMGNKSMQRLLWRMKHKNEPVENAVLSVELVERESVKDKI